MLRGQAYDRLVSYPIGSVRSQKVPSMSPYLSTSRLLKNGIFAGEKRGRGMIYQPLASDASKK